MEKIKITKNTPLKEILSLSPPCTCKACQHGCTIGSGLLVPEDIKPMADFLKISVEKLKNDFLEEVELFNKKHYRPRLLRKMMRKKMQLPYGKCIFFTEDGMCGVHSVKPLQCKIAMGCKDYGEDLTLWFMLNYVVDPTNPESIREFSDYLVSGGKTLKDGKLIDLVPDKERIGKILRYGVLK